MKKTLRSEKMIFSGKLHSGFWVLGISLLTAGVHNALNLIEIHSLLLSLVVGAVLGGFLFAYTHRHRKRVEGLHQTGAEVRQSEKKYRTFFENSADAMLIIEGDEFVDCNDATVLLLGYEHKEELLNIHPSKISPEFQPDGRSSLEKAEEMMVLARERGGHRFEWMHLRKDGEEIPIEVSLTAIENGNGVQIHAVWRDLTRWQAAEKALITSEGKYRALVESSSDWIWEIDADGNFSYTSPQVKNILGYEPEELIGTSPFDLMAPDEVQKIRRTFDGVWERGEAIVRMENINLHRNGHEVIMETSGAPVFDEAGNLIGYRGVDRDVTESRQTERMLQAVFDSAGDGILLADAQTQRFVVANASMAQMLGYSVEELKTMSVDNIHSPEDLEYVHSQIEKQLRREISLAKDIRLKRKDGTHFFTDVRSTPVELSGRPHLLGLFRDVTEQKDAKEKRENLEDQLRQAQKMEAVGQMAGGIAHDFNNLLQVISGYIELSEMSMKPDDPLASAVTEIGKAATRGKALINQLLAFSRRQVIQPVDLNLNDLIDPLLKMMRGLIGEHIELDFIAGRELSTIYADQGLMEQVLMNLCVNARDAMPNGGKLTIETENILIDGDYARSHSWATPGRYVLLNVTDTGCGMNSQVMERIFEPFFTTKEVGKGTGLGLSTVFGIIKQHNGHVNVYSEQDKGTIFKIYLPSVERNAAEVSRKPRGPIIGGTETILIAEDDEAVLALAEHLLADAGYTVLTAVDGEDAIRVFEEHADEIDAVMFDVVMPHLGGKQAMDRILELRPGLPHLFASGYSENAVHTNFIQKRGLHLLGKPYQTETLLRKIREVLDEK